MILRVGIRRQNIWTIVYVLIFTFKVSVYSLVVIVVPLT